MSRVYQTRTPGQPEPKTCCALSDTRINQSINQPTTHMLACPHPILAKKERTERTRPPDISTFLMYICPRPSSRDAKHPIIPTVKKNEQEIHKSN